MLLRSSPDVTELVTFDVFDSSHIYNVEDEDFMFAVSVEHYENGIKMDPRYVKWVANLISSTPDSFSVEHLPMSTCSEA